MERLRQWPAFFSVRCQSRDWLLRQAIGEQQPPNHEPGGANRPALIAKQASDFGIEPLPVNRTSELRASC